MTVTSRVPVFPSAAAEIVAVPAATPVTKPELLTVATLAADVVQVTVRFVSGFPAASFGVAES